MSQKQPLALWIRPGTGFLHPRPLSILAAPGTYLDSKLLLFLSGKFRAAVEWDVHLGHYLANLLPQSRAFFCRQEVFEYQEPIFLELQGRREPQALAL